MNGSRGVSINLASEPLRNNRFFRATAGALAVLLVGVMAAAGWLFVRHRSEALKLAREAASLRASVEAARTETERLESQARELASRHKPDVDFANELILGKSFSWVGLLSRLEEALPSESAVISLAPASAGGARAEVTLTAVFRNLNDLLGFVNNLYGRGFSRVRLVSEKSDGHGRLEAQIAVTYEGTL